MFFVVVIKSLSLLHIEHIAQTCIALSFKNILCIPTGIKTE